MCWGNLNIQTKSVSDGDNGIETIILQTGPNEINGNGITTLGWDGKWVEGACGFGSAALVTLAFDTGW